MTPPLPMPLNHVMAASANGKVYAIGGQTTESSEPDKAGFVDTVYEYDPAANKWTARAPMPTRRGGGAAAVVAVVLAVPLIFSLWATIKDIGASDPPDHYKAGMQWVRSNVQAGDIIFNTDWDDFPRMFYFDPTHRYVSGLDTAYLYDRNPDLSKMYERITLGKEDDPGPLIRDRFGARYVFTDNTSDHTKFSTKAMDSGWFEVVFEDKDCTVLHILDQKKEAPANQNDEDTGDDDEDENDNGG